MAINKKGIVMAENKFIKHLKGKQTAGSLVEIKNQNTPASFGNMPQGTSDSNVKYADVRGDVTVVANGTMAWKINDSALTLAPIVNGDGTDYISNYAVSGAGLWVNSTYTFPSTGDPNHPVAMIFNPNTKWVLKLCGDNLIVNNGETLELNVIITIGSSNIISKQFTIREQANQFCKELVIDFDESSSALIKASGLSTMQLQVLCGTADASARIYNGMTTLTVLQRKVDASVVSGSFANVEEVLRDGILPSDYFNNGDIINQIPQNGLAFPVFRRDGDYMLFVGWGDTSLSLEGGIYNVDEIVLSHRIYVDLPVFQSALQNRALLSSNDDIHQYLVPYYSTHCSMFIPKQNTIQQNIWTPLYSDQNTSSIVAYIKTNNIVSPLNPGISASSTPDDSVLVYFPLLGQTESDAVNVCLVRHKIY